MFELWKLFLKCLRESQVDCVFIIIDSIDYLQDAQASDGSGEEEAVLVNIPTLLRDSNILIKVLLRRRSGLGLPDLTEEKMALMTTTNLHPRATMLWLSLAIVQDEMLLVPQRLGDPRKVVPQSLTFSQLSLIYPRPIPQKQLLAAIITD
ncbi:hypothetical protein TASIC1_0012005300 [Trichoderma asperellum]|uniref:Uncharacterized protein n=1 Tax=Trichoderma asperellum TaxID=101201 RepID=A0A6V8R3A8_TRIAP|nr:hypothetical protein TASIC1_0012005300 [Trichoderma asperellum]